MANHLSTRSIVLIALSLLVLMFLTASCSQAYEIKLGWLPLSIRTPLSAPGSGVVTADASRVVTEPIKFDMLEMTPAGSGQASVVGNSAWYWDGSECFLVDSTGNNLPLVVQTLEADGVESNLGVTMTRSLDSYIGTTNPAGAPVNHLSFRAAVMSNIDGGTTGWVALDELGVLANIIAGKLCVAMIVGNGSDPLSKPGFPHGLTSVGGIDVATSMASLADVDLTTNANGMYLRYDSGSSTWYPVVLSVSEYGGYDQVLFVDGNTALATPSQSGTAERPYKTIQQALTHIGQPTNATEYKQNCVITVAPAEYIENLTVPHRAITIKGHGVKITGNVTREIGDEYEYGTSSSVWRGTLSLVGYDDGRDNHQLARQGIRITGNYRCMVEPGKTGYTTHDTYFKCVRIDGTCTSDDGVVNGGATPTGTEAFYLDGVQLNGTVEGRGFYCQRWHRVMINTATTIVNTFGLITESQFEDGDIWSGFTPMTVTVTAGYTDPPNNEAYTFMDCTFRQVTLNTTPAGKTLRLDGTSYYWWKSGVTLGTNPPTVTLVEDSLRGVRLESADGTVIATFTSTLVEVDKTFRVRDNGAGPSLFSVTGGGTKRVYIDPTMDLLVGGDVELNNTSGTTMIRGTCTVDNYLIVNLFTTLSGMSCYGTTFTANWDDDDLKTLSYEGMGGTPTDDDYLLYQNADNRWTATGQLHATTMHTNEIDVASVVLTPSATPAAPSTGAVMWHNAGNDKVYCRFANGDIVLIATH